MKMKKTFGILFAAGIILVCASFLLALVMMLTAPESPGVGIIGGSDGPTYILLFKRYSIPVLITGSALAAVSAAGYLICRKSSRQPRKKL